MNDDLRSGEPRKADDSATALQPAPYFQHARREIEPLLPAQISHVLELGCAYGNTMRWIRGLRRVDRAVGVELSPQAAEHAREVFDHVQVGNLNAWTPDLSGETFDVVLALDVLEHLLDPWRLLRFIHQHMTPNGVFLASVPNVSHYYVAAPLLLRGEFNYADEGLLDRTHLRFFTRESAISMFESSGFAVQRVESNRVYPSLLKKVGLKGERWRRLDRRLAKALLPDRLTSFQYLVQAGRRG